MLNNMRIADVTNDLSRFETFAEAFGFEVALRSSNTIYYRGYGKDPYVYVATRSSDAKSHFKGAAFVAASSTDFEKAAKLPDATSTSLDGAPGGGDLITITRPNGTYLHIVYGQQEQQVSIKRPPTATYITQGRYNTALEKPRLGRFQRYQPGPALVYKLGHYGYICNEFDSEVAFYTSNFNFVPSDILHDPQHLEIDAMTFIYLDLGKEYSDHHSIFFARAPPEVTRTYLHLSSFEVDDFDTQLLGHQHLASEGWKRAWGVGRHILGSQVFDYWKDSSNYNIEHYDDGDMVNVDTPTKKDAAGPISIWGPELPKDFGGEVE